MTGGPSSPAFCRRKRPRHWRAPAVSLPAARKRRRRSFRRVSSHRAATACSAGIGCRAPTLRPRGPVFFVTSADERCAFPCRLPHSWKRKRLRQVNQSAKRSKMRQRFVLVMDTHPTGHLLVHPLPAAPNFVGRAAELQALRDLWQSGFRGVVALVGLGGAGKTALAAKFLDELMGGNAARQPQKLFLWSF